MKSIESKKRGSFVKVSFMILLTTCVHVLTLMKSTIVASSFGTSEGIDAYNLANSIVSFIFSIAVSGVSTIIIPEYANKRAKSVVDTFITVVYGGTLMASVVIIIFRDKLIDLLSNKGDYFSSIAASVIVLLLFSQYLTAFSGITVAFFQCENKHNIPKLINLLCQTLVLFVLMYLNGKMDILEYAMIISGGNILCFVVDTAVAINSGWRFKPTLHFSNACKAALSKFVPIIFSGGVYRLSLLIDSMIASLLTTGMITILGYSTQISLIASSIVVGNLLIYIYPKITKDAQTNGYQDRFWEQAHGLHAIVCLMAAGFICVGKEAVFVLLHRGKFSSGACEIVFYASAIYIFGQGISIIRDMVYRYFYAIGNTKTPAQNSILVSICNISLSLIFVKLIGFYGLILGTVSASFISLVMIMTRFQNIIGFSMSLFQITKNFFLNFVVMLVTTVVVSTAKRLIPIENNLLSIIVFGVQTVTVYIAIQWAINRSVITALKKL